jgi:hypothetical protein
VRRGQLERLVAMMIDNLNKEGEYVQGITGMNNPAMSIENHSPQ